MHSHQISMLSAHFLVQFYFEMDLVAILWMDYFPLFCFVAMEPCQSNVIDLTEWNF